MTPEQWRYWAAEVAAARQSAETDTFSALTVAVDKIVHAAREYVRTWEAPYPGHDDISGNSWWAAYRACRAALVAAVGTPTATAAEFHLADDRCSECGHGYGYGSMLQPPYTCPIRGTPCTGWEAALAGPKEAT